MEAMACMLVPPSPIAQRESAVTNIAFDPIRKNVRGEGPHDDDPGHSTLRRTMCVPIVVPSLTQTSGPTLSSWTTQ